MFVLLNYIEKKKKDCVLCAAMSIVPADEMNEHLYRHEKETKKKLGRPKIS